MAIQGWCKTTAVGRWVSPVAGFIFKCFVTK